eukprot:12969457-Alexandrium_andersonii.AAC.1
MQRPAGVYPCCQCRDRQSWLFVLRCASHVSAKPHHTAPQHSLIGFRIGAKRCACLRPIDHRKATLCPGDIILQGLTGSTAATARYVQLLVLLRQPPPLP